MSFLSSENISALSEEPAKTCLFCPKLTNFYQTFLMLNKALFLKYSSSQNYYYTKDIQELMDNSRKSHVISFKDAILYEENEEYLTKSYKTPDFQQKISYLTEYYKYHKEVPRLFMHPSANTINHFHDKKRRIEYYKIKKMLAFQKKGVIVTGNKEENTENSESNHEGNSEKNGENEKKTKNFFEKPISRILDNLNFSDEKSEEKEKNKKKFTINKSIKSKLQSKIEEIHEKKQKILDISGVSLQELNFFLGQVVVKPKNREEMEEEDLKTLIPTEITDIFFDEDQTMVNNEEKNEKIKEITIFLEKNNQKLKGFSSPKEIIVRKKPVFPVKNNFLSPKTSIHEGNFKKKPLFSEKLMEKFIPFEKIINKTENLKKNVEKLEKSEKFEKNQKLAKTEKIEKNEKIPQNEKTENSANFKKKKSNSIASLKEKDIKTELFLKKILDQKENPHQSSHPFLTKASKISPPKTSLRIFSENKLHKVEKFIKIYKSNINSLQKISTNRDQTSQIQSKTTNLSNNIKEFSDNLQNMSNSKSFCDKKSTNSHRRVNSTINSTVNTKKKPEFPLEKVQEILKNKNSSTFGLKLQNNNTLHRKMPSEIYTPQEKIQNFKPNLLIMSRSQVNNKIKFFNNGAIHLSAKENISDLKRGRNKSLEAAKKNEMNLANNHPFNSKTTSKKSFSTSSAMKNDGLVRSSINNLKHSVNARENINPASN